MSDKRMDFAGQTLTVRLANSGEEHEYDVEGYWDVVTGGSWMWAEGNPAALQYAMRTVGTGIPLDDDVLYGRIGPIGHLVHVSEIVS